MKGKRGGAFRDLLKGKVVLVGTGNVLRGDDGLGPELVERLRKRLRVPCIDAGTALENHLGRILREKPDTLLLIDAVHLGAGPGDYRLLDAGELAEQGLSTHDMSLRLALRYLEGQMPGRVTLLGVQPARLDFGEGLSARVRRAVGVLERRIAEALC